MPGRLAVAWHDGLASVLCDIVRGSLSAFFSLYRLGEKAGAIAWANLALSDQGREVLWAGNYLGCESSPRHSCAGMFRDRPPADPGSLRRTIVLMTDKRQNISDFLALDEREDINRIAVAHGAQNVRVFGSVRRGEVNSSSDLDLLVDMSEGRSLFDLVALGDELQEDLGVASPSLLRRAFRHTSGIGS